MREFELQSPIRVVFGPGAEARAASVLEELGAKRVLLLAQSRHREGAERVAAALGERSVGIFDGVTVQVPEDVAAAATQMARERDADWVVAHGGGSAIGVAKAVALELEVRVGAIPTTYAGSERTPIWGRTRAGIKETGRDERVRPQLVIYDPSLAAGLPQALSLLSLLNALAHSVETLYAAEASDAARDAARASLAPLRAGMEALAADPGDLDGRAEALYGAALAGEALGGASMALHHKLAHVLGGEHGLPHAQTHAVLLPHTLAFNGPEAPAMLAAMREVFGDDPARWLAEHMRAWGLPTSLEALGLGRADLGRVVARAVEGAARYPNPRTIDAAGLGGLLDDAWHGRTPIAEHGRRVLADRSGAHAGVPATLAGAPLESARLAVLAVHGRGSNADAFVAQLRSFAGAHEDVAWLAPQALANSWYPHGFQAPWVDNQPQLDGALAALDAAWAELRRALPAERIVVVGFSQGACLALTWLEGAPAELRPKAVLAFSGAPTPRPEALAVADGWAKLRGVPVHLGKSEDDRWVPCEPFDAAAEALRAAGAELSVHRRPGDLHAIHDFDRRALVNHLDPHLEQATP
ncbi:iron-containing alcohol dehydrogenase [Plesiocystis pacifica]|uniref:iron-containing alcohol dehydrogenase n=1 Tax=Plesiocystis pacifica TaxID=191768 RepID=UPI000A306FE6|nr:iron-containing alcohol dehydrogenase [Plesiocystis pacifica]